MTRQHNKYDKREPKRIIIFRPGALGDTLVTAPLVWAIKNKFPGVTIEYISEKHTNSSVVTGSEAINLIPGIQKSYLYVPSSDWRTRLRELRLKIMPCKEDILLYLCYQRSSVLAVFRDFLFFKLLGFRQLVGFRGLLKDVVCGKAHSTNESEYQRLFRLSSSLELEQFDYDIDRFLNLDDEWGKEYCRENNLDDYSVIVVCPGSKMQSKRWPAKRYADVLSELGSDKRLLFIIIGDNNDRDISDYICRNTSANVISAVGTTLLQTSTIFSRAKLYIGNDTGPMHMAALHKVPCVAIFSSTNRKGKWHPWGKNHIILRKELPCSGCLKETCHSELPECLAEIDVDTVTESAKSILDKKGLNA
jgi:lipopolysaccharide heptosyltransferase III